MCGLAGLSQPADAKNDAGGLAAALLRQIERRGPHATGAAWDTGDGNVALTKVPYRATVFLQHRRDTLPTRTGAMILHTRYATHGSVDNRDNNHPVVHDRIIGTHNGVLQNHADLFKLAGRKPLSQVDSEAVMALLNTPDHPTTVLGAVRGDAALAWLDLSEPGLLKLARLAGRPLHVAQTRGGTFMYASTVEALKLAAAANNSQISWKQEVPEATYLEVRAGRIITTMDIPGVVKTSEEFRKAYAHTSGAKGPARTKRPVSEESKAAGAKIRAQASARNATKRAAAARVSVTA